MDSTRDSPRPGSLSDERIEDRNPPQDVSATGMNAGPERRALPASEDAIMGTTSGEEPELRGKPRKGSRLNADT